MSDQPHDIMLDHLRHIRGVVDGLRADNRDLKQRITAVELGLAAVRREIAVLAEADAHIGARIDAVGDRLDRIERRLDIIPVG